MRRVTNCGWLWISFRHIGHERFFLIHSPIHDEWYSCAQAKILTSWPLRYDARQIEHSETESPSDKPPGEGDGERQIVTGDGLCKRLGLISIFTSSRTGRLGLEDSLSTRWITVGYSKRRERENHVCEDRRMNVHWVMSVRCRHRSAIDSAEFPRRRSSVFELLIWVFHYGGGRSIVDVSLLWTAQNVSTSVHAQNTLLLRMRPTTQVRWNESETSYSRTMGKGDSVREA